MIVATEALEQIRDLYESGQYLQAYDASKQIGPLTEWSGTAAKILAGRLANNLGAIRLGRVLHRLAYRQDPEDNDAKYYYALCKFMRQGPLRALQFVNEVGDLPGGDAELRGAWHMLKCFLLGVFRDFQQADLAYQRAYEIAPESSWVAVQWSDVLEMQDRHEESLETSMKALELQPWYRPAVQSASHCLVQANRIDDALQLLVEANQRIESGDLLAQLAALQTELEMYDEARHNWERLRDLYPLIQYEKDREKWLATRLADATFYCEDYDAAIEWAEKSESPFHEAIAERLRTLPREKHRVMLPVGFVRQHHLTCSPATLSALCEYCGAKAEHLDVVERICYDGTPAHNERRWAESSGLVAREFRVTWDSAIALLDAGIPFTLTTVDPGNAHLQAVIGYDRLRGTLLVRDPTQRMHTEFRAEEMIKHYAPTGPRGMVLTSSDKKEALAAINLPDVELYDDYFAVESALSEHDRARAEAVYDKMRSSAAKHRMTYYAGRALAAYDANPFAMLENVDGLLDEFSEDTNLILAKTSALQEIGHRDERLKSLKSACDKKDADPLFLIEYARELSEDSRETEQVESLLRRIVRGRPTSGAVYDLLARLRWSQMRREEANWLYRLAACLEDKNEAHAKTYFVAARHLKKMPEVLDFLEDRVRRYGRRSSLPAQSLCWAYDQLEQSNRAFEILEAALAEHPDDGDLMIYSANFYQRYGKFDEAERLLIKAEEKTNPAAWLRSAASLAANQSDLRKSLTRWLKVLELEPMAYDANHMAAELLAALEDDTAAIAHLSEMVKRFPHNYNIRQLRIEWAAREEPKVAEQAVRGLLESYSNDPWARRELALALLNQNRLEEAREQAELAVQLETTSPIAHTIVGRIDEAEGKTEQARRRYHQSLEISVDYEPAIDSLMQICDTKQERVDALHFIAGQLDKQVTFGEGLALFRIYASATIEPEEVLNILGEALEARPDLWYCWMTLIQQFVEMEKLDDALGVAQRAVAQFPLLPRIWLELAAVHRRRENPAEEIQAIEKALEISPGWGDAERQLAAAHQRADDLPAAEKALERAIRYDPRECRNHSVLAEVLWEKGDRDAAIRTIKHSVILEPGHDTAWNLLRDWSIELDQPQLAIEAARELCGARPNEARSWLVLSEVLEPSDSHEEYLSALDSVIQNNPRSGEAFSKKAFRLAELGKFDEALSACQPPIFGDKVPVQLRGRKAQILAMRGDIQDALAQMNRVVRDDPDYAWAWSQLADWYSELGDNDKYIHAAEQLVRVSPQLAAAHGYLGDALMNLDRREDAIREFETSIELAPDYFYGTRYLIELYLEENSSDNRDAAERVLEATRTFMPPGYERAYTVRLAVAKHERKLAIEQLKALCAESVDESDPIYTALRGADDLLSDEEIAAATRDAVAERTAHPDLAYIWAQVSVRAGRPQHVKQALKKPKQPDDFWANMAAGYLSELVDVGQGPVALKFIRSNRSALRAHDVSWRVAGESLSDLDQRGAAVEWLADWQQRTDVTQRTLFCLSLSQRVLGKTQPAHDVNTAALQLTPDVTWAYHHLWLACDATLAGDAGVAGHHLQLCEGAEWNDYYQTLHNMIGAAASGLQGTPSAQKYGIAMRKLRNAYRPSDKLLKRIYYQNCACLATRYGHGVKAWYYRIRASLS